MAAIAADREGKTSLILERTAHIGGLPANGLGATDIQTRGAIGGLFKEFVEEIKSYYVATYGPDAQQVKDCDEGYHFEPSVAERILEQMLAECSLVTVKKERQFDALPENLLMENNTIRAITITNRQNGASERYQGKVFIDATYEGDLIAAAGVPFVIGREGFADHQEPYAGQVYKPWGGSVGEGTTLQNDNAIQAFNYRLCLTQDTNNWIPVSKPDTYQRDEYVSLIEDVRSGRHTGMAYYTMTDDQRMKNEQRVAAGLTPIVPGRPEGVQRLVNKVVLPNGKTDANNQHLAFISTDLPEENWPWPTSGWAWRDQFAQRLEDYTLGLLWFAQNDPELPDWFRQQCQTWGLAKDEYVDNQHFPRQVYVREGRRMKGQYWFTAHDVLPVQEGERPPVHSTSISAGHYAVDSHGVRKREPGKVHLDGFINYETRPYTIPYGVMVPDKTTNLLAPVPVSGTHLGFSTLRMEPTWMALGEAAGVAATVSIENDVAVQVVPIITLQQRLLDRQAVLIYFEDLAPFHPNFKAFQFFALKGLITSWTAKPDQLIKKEEVQAFNQRINRNLAEVKGKSVTRAAFYQSAYDQMVNTTQQKNLIKESQ